MSSIESCDREARRRRLESRGGVNALDYVEVVAKPASWPVSSAQRLLRVTFLHEIAADLWADNLLIEGGSRVPQVQVGWAMPCTMLLAFRDFVEQQGYDADDLLERDARLDEWKAKLGEYEHPVVGIDWDERLSDEEGESAFEERWKARLGSAEFRRQVTEQWSSLRQALGLPELSDVELDSEPDESAVEDYERRLAIWTVERGDFSVYQLRLVSTSGPYPPPGYDPVLSNLELNFKVDCPTDADCRTPTPEEGDRVEKPSINYLAKDYASFRQLMLDRLSQTMPDWQDRNAADVGMAAVEVLAYAADQLSYYQDAVATEAYLETARRRVSVRRHARLVDYQMHEGHNARAWVWLAISDGHGYVDPTDLWHDDGTDEAAIRFLTQCPGVRPDLPREQYPNVLEDWEPQVFEPIEHAYLSQAHTEIGIHHWGDPGYTLPRGATSAALRVGEDAPRLMPGDLLVFEQSRDPQMGPEVADPSKRHVVRLTEVYPPADEDKETREREPAGAEQWLRDPIGEDPWEETPLVEVHWARADRLPFDLPVARQLGDTVHTDLAVARGNVVLVDHGATVTGHPLPKPKTDAYRPVLDAGPISHATAPPDPKGPAGDARRVDPSHARPQVRVREQEGSQKVWQPRPDLLRSDRLDREFVVEIDGDRRAHLRFGDGTNGRRPVADRALTATYRRGNGVAGNVAAQAIAHVVGCDLTVTEVSNPLAAFGGADPEPLEQVRKLAPRAFRRQQRAVTVEDYARMAERHPQVQRAVATRRWTGSWHTTFVSVDRVGGRPVDRGFEDELRGFLEQFRLAGDDLEIEPPRTVPLEIRMTVCLEPGYSRSDVEWALERRFSSRRLDDGSLGFFHPDRFTFGQPLYLSEVVSAAMEVAGVRWVDLDPDTEGRENAFGRRFDASGDAYEDAKITVSRREVIQLDDDPNHPGRGTIDFDFEGAR